jgi:hypothetical protein
MKGGNMIATEKKQATFRVWAMKNSGRELEINVHVGDGMEPPMVTIQFPDAVWCGSIEELKKLLI